MVTDLLAVLGIFYMIYTELHSKKDSSSSSEAFLYFTLAIVSIAIALKWFMNLGVLFQNA
jgi:hypothetical protein